MERVAALINRGELRQALVRMWVLAGEPTVLSQWERERNRAQHANDVKTLTRMLQHAERVRTADVAARPLALVAALDAECALSTAMPISDVPFEESGRTYWLIPRRLNAPRQTKMAGQNLVRQAWFTWHSIVPARTSQDLEVSVVAASGRLATVLNEISDLGLGAIRVWIGHFSDTATLDSVVSPVSQKIRFRGIIPHELRCRSIVETFERAADARAQVVVLPELTVHVDGRVVAARWLRTHSHPFVLVVPGSFHEELDGDCFNTTELWNHMGEPILRHRKLRPYGPADAFAEDIAPGSRLTVLNSGLGLWAVVICKDFLDAHQSVATLFQEVPADWALVPSMGGQATWDSHATRAAILAKVAPGTSSIIANQVYEPDPTGPCAGFVVQAPTGTLVRVPVAGGPAELRFERVLKLS